MVELLVERHSREGRGHLPSLYYEHEVLTYGQLLGLVNRAGNGLRQLGVRREQRVLMAVVDSPAFVATFLGAMKIGAVPVPVTTLANSPDYHYFLQDSRARVLVVSAEILPRVEPALAGVPTLKSTLLVGGRKEPYLRWEDLVKVSSPHLTCVRTHRDEMSYWLYSSGTTGRPKAVIHLHGDMVHCVRPFQSEVARLNESDRVFSVAKMGFSYGLVNSLYLPLLSGAAAVLHSARPAPATILGLIRRYRPTVFFSVPTAYLRLLQHIDKEKPPVDFGSLRLCVSAGEPLPAWLFQQWGERFGLEILDGLGSTEVGYIYICSKPGKARPGSCGQLLPGFEGKLADEQGKAVAKGQMGELWVKAESTAASYWHDDQKTRLNFLGVWFRTQDALSQDLDGHYRFVGRRDDLFKVAGYWVSPLEVEALLVRHEAVAECAVVGVPDAYGLLKPHAFVCLKEGTDASPEMGQNLRQFLKDRLEPFKMPQAIEFVSSLPRTPTGKIQRVFLRGARGAQMPIYEAKGG